MDIVDKSHVDNVDEPAFIQGQIQRVSKNNAPLNEAREDWSYKSESESSSQNVNVLRISYSETTLIIYSSTRCASPTPCHTPQTSMHMQQLQPLQSSICR